MRFSAVILSLCLVLVSGPGVKNHAMRIDASESTHRTELPLSQRLPATVENYARKPNLENAATAIEAFSLARETLQRLQTEAAQTRGGARAEAEIARLELERLYRQEAMRFAALQARADAVRSALDALAAAAAVDRGGSIIDAFMRGGRRPPEEITGL